MHCEVFQWASYQIQLRGHSCPEKEYGDSSAFHYTPALPDYLGSSLPDMVQISWSTVWVTKSPGWNWILSFSLLVRNTAHFLSKLTTKFSHKMVSWGILALVSSLQNWVKKVNNCTSFKTLYNPQAHQSYNRGTGSICAYSGGSWCTYRGTVLIKRLHSPDFRSLVNSTSDISDKGQPKTISFLKLLKITSYNRKWSHTKPFFFFSVDPSVCSVLGLFKSKRHSFTSTLSFMILLRFPVCGFSNCLSPRVDSCKTV